MYWTDSEEIKVKTGIRDGEEPTNANTAGVVFGKQGPCRHQLIQAAKSIEGPGGRRMMLGGGVGTEKIAGNAQHYQYRVVAARMDPPL